MPEKVKELRKCEECGTVEWYMGYDDTGEFINECVECGFVFFP